MNDKSRRRWFRFSLRTMFVVVTLCCCYLGWESNVVRQRRAVLRELGTKPAYQITPAGEWAQRYVAAGGSFAPGSGAPKVARVRVVRVWLGDEAIQEIGYSSLEPGYQKSDLDRLTRTFPEARVYEHLPRLYEPCHPGCFPRGTLVDTPEGRRTVDGISPGELVTTILPTGETAVTVVQSVFVTDNRLWQVETDNGSLTTTETQPLCLSSGTIVAAGKLQPGDTILRRQGESVGSAVVQSVSPTERIEKVFNLVLGNCEIFVAGEFLARSKPPVEIAATETGQGSRVADK